MVKGLNGESCAEAVRSSIKPGEKLSYRELYSRTKSKGAWKESTLQQHLMALIVNLPPARFHWEHVDPFLMLNQDGTYELYDSARHPKTIE